MENPWNSINNWFLYFLSNPSFKGINRLFVLSFENEDGRTGLTGYYLPKVEIGTKMLRLIVDAFLIKQ